MCGHNTFPTFAKWILRSYVLNVCGHAFPDVCQVCPYVIFQTFAKWALMFYVLSVYPVVCQVGPYVVCLKCVWS